MTIPVKQRSDAAADQEAEKDFGQSHSVDALGEGTAEDWGWARGQRLAIGSLLFLLLIFLGIQYLRRPMRLDDPIAVEPGSFPELETAMDPNLAGAGELARIPHLGEKMAQAIVDYRELHRDEGGIAFQNLADLSRVHGIGKKALEGWRPYLRFPGDATQPAVGPHGLISPKIVTTEPDGGNPEGPER
jgi:competence ComEA-like helix-hairpin-helix protein